MVYGIWCVAYGVCHMVYGIWCMAYGVWHMVYGIWCMAYGVWHMVCGIWCVAYGVWHMVCGIWCVAYGVCIVYELKRVQVNRESEDLLYIMAVFWHAVPCYTVAVQQCRAIRWQSSSVVLYGSSPAIPRYTVAVQHCRATRWQCASTAVLYADIVPAVRCHTVALLQPPCYSVAASCAVIYGGSVPALP